MRLASLAALLLAALPPGAAAAQAHTHRREPPTAAVAAEDQPLLERVTLEAVLERVRTRNPEIAEAAARAQASEARVEAAGSLPSPEVALQLWQAPLDQPLDLSRANMLMLGVRQSLPAPGARDARTRAAQATALAGRDAVALRRLELENQARRAFAAWSHAVREEEVHLGHVDLNQQMVSLARGRFEAGRMSKRDLLRTTFELLRLHADVAGVQGLARASKALLNTLMGRDADAPLGTPVSPPREAEPDLAVLDARLDERPDLRAAAARLAEREATLEAARREAGWPALMVGADYGYMPMDGSHKYTVMVQAPLPWLWGGRKAEVTAAERDLAAARSALEAARRQARFELREARARLDTAREQHEILDLDLEPQARRGAEEAQAEFLSGQGEAMAAIEALNALLSVRLQRSRALQLLEEAEADLDRAAGLTFHATSGARP